MESGSKDVKADNLRQGSFVSVPVKALVCEASLFFCAEVLDAFQLFLIERRGICCTIRKASCQQGYFSPLMLVSFFSFRADRLTIKLYTFVE